MQPGARDRETDPAVLFGLAHDGYEGGPDGDAPRARTYEYGGWTVVEFHGEIDLFGREVLGPRMDELTAPTGVSLVVDLRPATFFDCSGLGLLCRAHRRVVARAGRMEVVCENELTLRAMHTGGLFEIFRPVRTVDEALVDEERQNL